MRLSVTDRCNLRCTYCMPKSYKSFAEPEHWLKFEEIERVVRIFANLGVRRIRLTGGEPLVRKDLPKLASRLNAIEGVEDLSLSTNAVLLAKQAGALKQAGIRRVNVSLDTLDEDKFRQITQGGLLSKVIEGLNAAEKSGLQPVKVNMVVMQDTTLDECVEVLEFCRDKGFTLRFIETMPMGSSGQDASQQFLSLETVRQNLQSRYDLIPGLMSGGGPAKYYRIANSDTEIGFITPISQHFCATCNRVRLSVEGTLYLCLGQDDKLELRPLLRSGCSDNELQQAILSAIARKPEKHEFVEKPQQVVRLMSLTGG